MPPSNHSLLKTVSQRDFKKWSSNDKTMTSQKEEVPSDLLLEK
jgi:hypothetical protein